MRLSEVIARKKDHKALIILGMEHGLNLSPLQPLNELQQEISRRLQDPAHLRAYIARLPQQDLLGLKVAVMGGKGEAAPIPEYCHRKINELQERKGTNGGRVIAELINRGLIFTGLDAWYRNTYIVPDEVREAVLALTANELGVDIPTRPLEPGTGRSALTLLSDLHLLLGWVKRQPLRIARTSGLIFRREQQRVVAYFNPPEKLPPATTNGYPIRLGVYLGFCRSHNLMGVWESDQGDLYLDCTPEATTWMTKSLDGQLKDISDYMKKGLADPFPSLGNRLLALLGSLPESKWLDCNSLAAELQRYAADPWYQVKHELDKALLFMAVFDFLETTSSGTDNDSFLIRLTRTGRHLYHGTVPDITEENTFLVQPNYEILVPRELNPALRWFLDTFTDLVKNDQMVVLRLTRESVYRAFKNGEDVSILLPFLGAHSRAPLPDNVIYSLREWSDRCGAMYLEQPLLLTCRTPEQAAEIAADPRFVPYLQGNLTPRHLIVIPDLYPEFLAALEKAGHMPFPRIARDYQPK